MQGGFKHVPDSRKNWQSLNLVVLPQTTFLTLLADLYLAVWYGIAICTCTRKKLADFNLAVERHTAKPPNFPAIRYKDFSTIQSFLF